MIKLQGWARDGLTDEDIAKKIGIGTTTLYRWKKDKREIRESLKKGKEIVDFEVENALLKRALGFKIKRTVQKVTKDGDVVNTTEEVYYAPDTTAQIFWLKNRKPDVWREKQDKQSEDYSKVDELLKKIEKEALE